MSFADLPAAEAIFLDANTFVYHFTHNSQFGAACTDRRVSLQTLTRSTGERPALFPVKSPAIDI